MVITLKIKTGLRRRRKSQLKPDGTEDGVGDALWDNINISNDRTQELELYRVVLVVPVDTVDRKPVFS